MNPAKLSWLHQFGVKIGVHFWKKLLAALANSKEIGWVDANNLGQYASSIFNFFDRQKSFVLIRLWFLFFGLTFWRNLLLIEKWRENQKKMSKYFYTMPFKQSPEGPFFASPTMYIWHVKCSLSWHGQSSNSDNN